MGYFLNPALEGRVADYARSVGKAQSAGNLVRLLNALHSLGPAGHVNAPQRHVAAQLGLSVEFVKKGEGLLVAAGLVRRLSKAGRCRILELVEPAELAARLERDRSRAESDASSDCGKPVENLCTTPPPLPDRGTGGHPIGVQPYTYSRPQLMERARVHHEEERTRDARARTADSRFKSAIYDFARAVHANAPVASRIASLAFDLQGLLGESKARDALAELQPWVLREARSNVQALALRALAARVRHARGERSKQLGLFP